MKKFLNNSTKLVIIALLVLTIPVGVTYASYKLNNLPIPAEVAGQQTIKKAGTKTPPPVTYEEVIIPGQTTTKINKVVDNSKKRNVFPNPTQSPTPEVSNPFPNVSYPVAPKSQEEIDTGKVFYDGEADPGVLDPSTVRFNVMVMNADNFKLQNLNNFVAYDVTLDLYWKDSSNTVVISSYDIGKISFNGGSVFRKDSTINSTPAYTNGIIVRQKVTFTDVNNDTYQYN